MSLMNIVWQFFLTNQEDNDDDDDANVITAASTMVSIACTAHCNNIPSYSCNVPQYILTRSDEDEINQELEFPPIDQLEYIIMNCSRSVTSRMSDLSVTESVMKENNYDDSNGNLRTLTNTSVIVSEE